MMKHIFFLIALVAIGACAHDSNVEKRDTNARDTILALMDIWESGVTDKLSEIVSEEAVYEDVPNNSIYEGVDGFASYVGHVHGWGEDVKIDILAVHDYQDHALAEWRMFAIQTGPIGDGITTITNAEIDLRGATLIEMRDGKIIRAADYIDVASFMAQLGFEFVPPGH